VSEIPAGPVVEVSLVTELLQLIDRWIGEEHVAARAERYRGLRLAPDHARQMAATFELERLRSLLAGLLAEQAGGATAAGIQWALAWLRTELDRTP
jgi:hypothetical protein